MNKGTMKPRQIKVGHYSFGLSHPIVWGEPCTFEMKAEPAVTIAVSRIWVNAFEPGLVIVDRFLVGGISMFVSSLDLAFLYEPPPPKEYLELSRQLIEAETKLYAELDLEKTEYGQSELAKVVRMRLEETVDNLEEAISKFRRSSLPYNIIITPTTPVIITGRYTGILPITNPESLPEDRLKKGADYCLTISLSGAAKVS